MPGLYVHIPFCEHKCVYCDFFSVTDRSQTVAFVDACVHEIALRAGNVRTDREFTSIFFGGGTPSILEAAQIGRIVEALHGAFKIKAGAECTMETNPGTVDARKLRDFRAAGINRMSIGVQSFFDDDLLLLGRIHSAEEAIRAVADAYDAGFDNMSIDLLFSVPGQTPERWSANLERARSLDVQHLSCYSLTVETATPLYDLVRSGAVRQLPVEADAVLYALTMETLEQFGYEHYEVSNYAKPGHRSLHNLSYWRLEDYLGFGPSAYSTWNDVRWRNASNIAVYTDALGKEKHPVQDTESLTPAQRREEYIFLSLRCEGIDEDFFRSRFNADFAAENRSVITQAMRSGLIEKNGAVFHLTKEGFLLCDELCARLK
jgi:oxygen-independent coproporphyrinogen III oxidase